MNLIKKVMSLKKKSWSFNSYRDEKLIIALFYKKNIIYFFTNSFFKQKTLLISF